MLQEYTIPYSAPSTNLVRTNLGLRKLHVSVSIDNINLLRLPLVFSSIMPSQNPQVSLQSRSAKPLNTSRDSSSTFSFDLKPDEKPKKEDTQASIERCKKGKSSVSRLCM